jgi:hypothetical protein
MTLKEWSATDRSVREKYEAECYRNGSAHQIGLLAAEAAKVLANDLAQIPEVTAVVAGEDNMARCSILMVTTTSRSGEDLVGIPSEFAGFPVVQFGVAERKADYMWRLGCALGAASIPKAEADTWLKRFDCELSNVGSVYYLHKPERWIAETIVAAVAKGRLFGGPLLGLLSDVRIALARFFEQADLHRMQLDPTVTSRLRATLREVFSRHNVEV